jgi:hypothetical protein
MVRFGVGGLWNGGSKLNATDEGVGASSTREEGSYRACFSGGEASSGLVPRELFVRLRPSKRDVTVRVVRVFVEEGA